MYTPVLHNAEAEEQLTGGRVLRNAASPCTPTIYSADTSPTDSRRQSRDTWWSQQPEVDGSDR